tara:strand:+ start:2407 stop:3240 length:834 start_codon:yes stop_codon:yes gene_type:complete
MSRFKYKDFFPINDSASLKKGNFKNLTKNEVKRWWNFKSITKSEYILDKLAIKQNNICPACNEIIKKSGAVIHHLDYERLCKYLEYNRILKPTIKQPNRKIKTPKCNECPETETCLDKLVLLHNNCHFKIHIIEGRIKKPKKNSGTIGVHKTQEEKLEYWKNSLTKNHKEIIQKSVNLIRELNPENEFHLKYYTRYISLKPSNSVTFKTNGNDISLKIKTGNLIEIKELLKNRGIESELYYKKGKLNNIKFLINIDQFNKNIDLIEIMYKYLIAYNN